MSLATQSRGICQTLSWWTPYRCYSQSAARTACIGVRFVLSWVRLCRFHLSSTFLSILRRRDRNFVAALVHIRAQSQMQELLGLQVHQVPHQTELASSHSLQSLSWLCIRVIERLMAPWTEEFGLIRSISPCTLLRYQNWTSYNLCSILLASLIFSTDSSACVV